MRLVLESDDGDIRVTVMEQLTLEQANDPGRHFPGAFSDGSVISNLWDAVATLIREEKQKEQNPNG